jgi:hypothetical protein
MFAIYFKWQVKEGFEQQFERLWSAGTQALRDEGSLGSALFSGGAGQYHALARWPDRETRDRVLTADFRPDIFRPFAECIEHMLAREEMDLIESQWVHAA